MYTAKLGSLVKMSTHVFIGPALWNKVKSKLKRMKVCPHTKSPSYLNEFMWRKRYWQNKRYGQRKRMAFNSIMRGRGPAVPV